MSDTNDKLREKLLADYHDGYNYDDLAERHSLTVAEVATTLGSLPVSTTFAPNREKRLAEKKKSFA